MTKKLFILSVTALTLGLAFVTDAVNVQNTVALYVALPAGAILFGLFMVFKSLEKESSLHDAEQEARPGLQKDAKPQGPARSTEVPGTAIAVH